MAFHVELRQGMRRAWAFNLDGTVLSRAILEPFRRGATVRLGDRDWDPRESTLRILDGPELAPPELAMGRGWANAERSAQDVTAALLQRLAVQEASIALIAETEEAHASLAELLDGLGIALADWAAVRARILAGATGSGPAPDLGVGAVLAVVESTEPDPAWLFDVGLALGVLGSRAIAVKLGDGPVPEPLSELAVARFDRQQPASAQALVERLHRATAG